MKHKSITITNPNFRVGPKGLALRVEGRGYAYFLPGDGIRVSAHNDRPYVEFVMDRKPVALALSKNQIRPALSRLRHESQYRTKELEFFEAFARTDIPTMKLVRSFSESAKSGEARKMLKIEKKIATMTFTEKVNIIRKTTLEHAGATILKVAALGSVKGSRPLAEAEDGEEGEETFEAVGDLDNLPATEAEEPELATEGGEEDVMVSEEDLDMAPHSEADEDMDGIDDTVDTFETADADEDDVTTETADADEDDTVSETADADEDDTGMDADLADLSREMANGDGAVTETDDEDFDDEGFADDVLTDYTGN